MQPTRPIHSRASVFATVCVAKLKRGPFGQRREEWATLQQEAEIDSPQIDLHRCRYGGGRSAVANPRRDLVPERPDDLGNPNPRRLVERLQHVHGLDHDQISEQQLGLISHERRGLGLDRHRRRIPSQVPDQHAVSTNALTAIESSGRPPNTESPAVLLRREKGFGVAGQLSVRNDDVDLPDPPPLTEGQQCP
jgi:hypothetical protein